MIFIHVQILYCVHGVHHTLYKYNAISCTFMPFRGFDKCINSELVYSLIHLYTVTPKDCEIKVHNVALCHYLQLRFKTYKIYNVAFIKAYCIQDILHLYRSPFSLMSGFSLFPRIFYLTKSIVPVH